MGPGSSICHRKKNSGKLFNLKKECSKNYPSTCMCPCSSLFKKWHKRNFVSGLPGFNHCDGAIYKNPTAFHRHLHSMQHEYYHRIVMRQVQNLYSALIAELKIPDLNTINPLKSTLSTSSSQPKGKVSLPLYVLSQSSYETITVMR